MKIRGLKIILGELLLIVMIVTIIFVVNLIPSKIMVESERKGTLVFPKVSERTFLVSEFMATSNMLNRIDILFKNPNLESRDEVSISLKQNNSVIAEKNFSGFNFGDTSRARLDFMAISNSKNVNYEIIVKATKIVDGKLAIGINENNLDCVYYYQSNSSFKNAFMRVVEVLYQIANTQVLVLLIPMVLWGMWLW